MIDPLGRVVGYELQERAEYSGGTIGLSMLSKRANEVERLRRNSPWHVFAAHPNMTLIALKKVGVTQ